MQIFTCENHPEAMLTCIYEAWDWEISHREKVKLQREPIIQPTLFDEYHHVEIDREKAKKVMTSIYRKISWEAYTCVYYVMLAKQDTMMDIYQFLKYGFKNSNVMAHLAEPIVCCMMQIARNVQNEMHSLREFVRFDGIGEQVYIAHIEPKHAILSLLAEHFSDRMPSEDWMLIDDGRKLAAVHPKNESFYIREMTGQEAERLAQSEQIADPYHPLWQTFFDTIAIEQRKNTKCQRNLFPNWRRKHVTEFRQKL